MDSQQLSCRPRGAVADAPTCAGLRRNQSGERAEVAESGTGETGYQGSGGVNEQSYDPCPDEADKHDGAGHDLQRG